MEFDIDVSGADILNKNYSIVISDNNDIVRGYKFDERTIFALKRSFDEGKFRYKSSKQALTYFKIRLYCIIVYFLFNDIITKIKSKKLFLNICRDFQGHEKDITSNLLYFLRNLLGLDIEIRYVKLPDTSNADKYAFLMRKDNKDKIEGYVKISIDDIIKYLK